MFSWACSILTLYFCILFWINVTSDEEENEELTDDDIVEEADNLMRPIKCIILVNTIRIVALILGWG